MSENERNQSSYLKEPLISAIFGKFPPEFVEEGKALRERISTNPQLQQVFELFKPTIATQISEQMSYYDANVWRNAKRLSDDEDRANLTKIVNKRLFDAGWQRENTKMEKENALRTNPALLQPYRDLEKDYLFIAE